jgi:hypothetical protein
MFFYSSGLHISRGRPDHYTSFGFQREGDALREKWSLHVADDGLTCSYRPAADEGRVILRKEIKHLFVRILFFHSILFY